MSAQWICILLMMKQWPLSDSKTLSAPSRPAPRLPPSPQPLLEGYGAALHCAHGEQMIVRLLAGHETFTLACGLIGARQQRDAFLSTLCKFTLQAPQAPQGPKQQPSGGVTLGPFTIGSGHGHGSSTSSGIASALPRALMRLESAGGGSGGGSHGVVDSRSISSSGGGGGGHQQGPSGPVSSNSSAEDSSKVLSSKNLQALRTLFNCAIRLAHSLGPSWRLVLETLAALERVLASPRTTVAEVTQSGCALGRRHEGAHRRGVATLANDLQDTIAAVRRSLNFILSV